MVRHLPTALKALGSRQAHTINWKTLCLPSSRSTVHEYPFEGRFKAEKREDWVLLFIYHSPRHSGLLLPLPLDQKYTFTKASNTAFLFIRAKKDSQSLPTFNGSRHRKMCIRAYADSKGLDQPMGSLIRAFLSANRIIRYYRMYEWRAKAGGYFTHEQDDLNMPILLNVQRPLFCLMGPLKYPDNEISPKCSHNSGSAV